MAIKIIYILSDGRSGSTLLESILNSSLNAISIGEGYRFWERYYKGETLCGCEEAIQRCLFWNEIHNKLQSSNNYDHQRIRSSIKDLLRFEKFKKIESIVRDSGLYEIIRSYYTAIAEKSGKDFIIDSSKSASWCKVLSCFKEFDLRIIHLERELPYVAESWKKSVRLPEFYDQEKYMPVKKDLDIIRTWIKVKILGNSFKKSNNYVFVRYKELCSNPAKTLAVLGKFIGAEISQDREIILKQSHSIAGNPIRFEKSKTISIQNSKRQPDLPWQRHLYFLLVNRISNLFFR